jgi:murein L,D-transpeptidase YcbB/YkuD
MAPHNKFTLFLLVLVTLSSCQTRVNTEEFAQQLQTVLTKSDTKAKAGNRSVTLYEAYNKNSFAPIWTDEKGSVKKGEEFIEELRGLWEDGIDTGRYRISYLSEVLKKLDKQKGHVEITDVIAYDTLFSKTYILAASDLLMGILDAEETDDMWFHDNDTTWAVADRLAESGYTSLEEYRSKIPLYSKLKQERKRLHETRDDSLLRAVDVNLERLRWLPQELEATNITVIIPQMQLYLKDDNKEVMNMKVVLGRADRETPSLNAPISNVVFNPSWGVPPGIMKKDVIPGMLSKGEAYLNKKGLKIYDRAGNEVPASKVNEENYKSYVFRQPPSERNALGQVKFDMPNPWNIYLHDTPSKDDFEKDDRTKSSGCVRLHYPLQLTEYLLMEMNGKEYNRQRIDSLTATNDTKYVKLKYPLPVHLVYLTVADNGNSIIYLKDIYGKDVRLYSLMQESKSVAIR